MLANEKDAFQVQNLVQLSLDYARRGADMGMRCRLLRAILDSFGSQGQIIDDHGRLDQAWTYAFTRLADIRGLSDVSAGIGLSESAFRSLHRNAFGGSAGKYLMDLRLNEAERRLATTGDSVGQVARAVGYAHAESFSHAFARSRNRTPAAYRRWCKRFA